MVGKLAGHLVEMMDGRKAAELAVALAVALAAMKVAKWVAALAAK